MAHLYRCSICLDFLSPSVKLLMLHIGRVHANEANFHVICGLDGCCRKFVSFRHHLFRKHPELLHTNAHVDLELGDDNNAMDVDDDAGGIDVNDEQPVPPNDGRRDEEDAQRANALFLLKFKEKGCVTQKVVDCFIESATSTVQNCVDLLKTEVQRNLDASGTDFNAVPGLANLFDEDNLITSPFKGIEKEAQQYQYYKEQFNLVVSITFF